MNLRPLLSRNHRKEGERRKILAALLVGSVLMLTLVVVPDIVRSVALPVAAFSWKMEAGVLSALDSFWSLLHSKKELAEENRKLRKDLSELESTLLDRNLLAEENLELKDMLGRPDARESVLGIVLVHPPRSPYDTLIIDVGSRRGVEGGDLVVAGENIPIGRIAEVSRETSRVTLFSTAGETTQVRIETLPALFEAVGLGGGNFSVRVPGDRDVPEGALVGISSIAPNVLGVAAYSMKESTGAFQTVLFRSPVNIFEIDKVRVVRGYTYEGE